MMDTEPEFGSRFGQRVFADAGGLVLVPEDQFPQFTEFGTREWDDLCTPQFSLFSALGSITNTMVPYPGVRLEVDVLDTKPDDRTIERLVRRLKKKFQDVGFFAVKSSEHPRLYLVTQNGPEPVVKLTFPGAWYQVLAAEKGMDEPEGGGLLPVIWYCWWPPDAPREEIIQCHSYWARDWVAAHDGVIPPEALPPVPRPFAPVRELQIRVKHTGEILFADGDIPRDFTFFTSHGNGATGTWSGGFALWTNPRKPVTHVSACVLDHAPAPPTADDQRQWRASATDVTEFALQRDLHASDLVLRALNRRELARIAVPPGHLGVRVIWTNRDTSAREVCLVQIWAVEGPIKDFSFVNSDFGHAHALRQAAPPWGLVTLE